jgi:2-hydroxy-6-oxonona-2,4-dienedioate hydrolase
MQIRRGGLLLSASLLVIAIVVIVIWWRFENDITVARARATKGSVMITTSCGPIEYQEAGQGVPLLIVHGSGGGHDQGMLFARSFTQKGEYGEKSVRVIAMSRFGYLRTPLPADASPAAQADAHACLLDALGIRQAAVLGASAGAPSATQMSIRHPDRVNALILLVPLAYKPAGVADSVPAPSPMAEKFLMSLVGSDFVFWVALHAARDQVIKRVLATPPELVAAANAAERARVDAMLKTILPVSARADGLRNETKIAKNLQPYALEAIRAPTLIISARDDGYGTFASAQYTASKIAGARFIGFEQGGHMTVGHGDEVQQEILKLLISSAKP